MPLCCVCHMSSNSWQSRHEKLSFHRFPQSRPFILKLWLEFAQIPEGEDLRHRRLCSRHFNAEDFIGKAFMRKLNCGALPCLCPPKSPPKSSPKSCPPSVGLTQITSGSGDDEVLECVPDIITESVTFDHDYIVTTTAQEPQTQESCEVKQKPTSNQPELEDVKKELCRLCGQKTSVLMPIFDAPSIDLIEDVPISSKVEMYLPVKVKKDDPLPSCICSDCNYVLNRWHELYVTCVAADAVLWKTFGGESDKSSQIDQDSVITRVLGHAQQDEESSIIPEIEIQSQEEPLVPLISDEAEKGPDAFCAECGKKKTLSTPIEEDSFGKEINEHFLNFDFGVYMCRYCCELFETPGNRKSHVAMCRQLSTICELCGFEVSCRKDLHRHRCRKRIRQRYLCEKCKKFFKNAASLNDHIKRIHDQDLSTRYHCVSCCIAFVSEQQFCMHQVKHSKGMIKSEFPIKAVLGESSQNSGDSLVYPCPVCRETFSDALSLVVHLTTKKQVKCPICRKKLANEKRFILHECKHWSCRYCLKAFVCKNKWILHERLHTGEKPLKCRICDATFRTWELRRRHEAIHNPKFECPYCSKSFRDKCVFQDHVLCHEGKSFLCQICDKNFSGRRSLWKHISGVHKIPKPM